MPKVEPETRYLGIWLKILVHHEALHAIAVATAVFRGLKTPAVRAHGSLGTAM
jgi:hypothetical protein